MVEGTEAETKKEDHGKDDDLEVKKGSSTKSLNDKINEAATTKKYDIEGMKVSFDAIEAT